MTEKRKSFIIFSLIATLIYASIIFLFGELYYYVNDDYIMRDILSGRYSGVGDAHIYNLVYPFALLFKTLYSIFPTVDFYGFFLLTANLGCLCLILNRVLTIRPENPIFTTLLVSVIYTCLGLYFTIFFTFTFTGFLCAATALFLLITETYTKPFINNLLCLCLLTISFCLRKDTCLMVLPYFFLFFLIKIIKSGDRKTVFLKIVNKMLITSIFWLALWSIHIFSYASPEYQDFLEFRSLRKAVHDYTRYPDWDTNIAFYDSLGLSYGEYLCVGTAGDGVNTVFDYSPDINTIYKAVIAQNEHLNKSVTFGEKLSIGLNKIYSSYKSQVLNQQIVDIWIFTLLLTIFLYIYKLISKKDFSFILAGNSVLIAEILYLGYKGRITEVVLFSVFAGSIIYTLTNLLIVAHDDLANKLRPLLFSIFLLCCIPMIQRIDTQRDVYIQRADKTNSIITYSKVHPENTYFLPALSISGSSFALEFSFNSSFNNCIILGGWNAFSPIYDTALDSAGLTMSIEESLLYEENYYIIANTNYIWNIVEYFTEKYGNQFKYEAIDTVNAYEDIVWRLYLE